MTDRHWSDTPSSARTVDGDHEDLTAIAERDPRPEMITDIYFPRPRSAISSRAAEDFRAISSTAPLRTIRLSSAMPIASLRAASRGVHDLHRHVDTHRGMSERLRFGDSSTGHRTLRSDSHLHKYTSVNSFGVLAAFPRFLRLGQWRPGATHNPE